MPRLFGLGLLCASALATAAPAEICIVIDDIGNNLTAGRRAIALPAPVALAVLPHTAHGPTLARDAARAGKEVLLHLPMDAQDRSGAEPGPGRIEQGMSEREIDAMLAYNLETVPQASGINNHMGGRLTQDTDSMRKLMRVIHRRGGLFFLDSLTSPHSLAAHIATEQGIATIKRDVFLDHDRGEAARAENLRRLERLLATRGYAVVIGHPYPETLAMLEHWLPTLAARDIRVVPVSVMLQRQRGDNPNAKRTTPARPGL